jgi:hypothetical protein
MAMLKKIALMCGLMCLPAVAQAGAADVYQKVDDTTLAYSDCLTTARKAQAKSTLSLGDAADVVLGSCASQQSDMFAARAKKISLELGTDTKYEQTAIDTMSEDYINKLPIYRQQEMARVAELRTGKKQTK